MIHIVKGFGIVNKAEIDVFLELSCFFDNPEAQRLRWNARRRGATPCPRSGEATKSARLRWRRNGGEELPKSEVRGGGREELPTPPRLRPEAAARRTNPTPKARSSSREDQTHIQGAVAARAQEGLELFHIEEQKGKQ